MTEVEIRRIFWTRCYYSPEVNAALFLSHMKGFVVPITFSTSSPAWQVLKSYQRPFRLYRSLPEIEDEFPDLTPM